MTTFFVLGHELGGQRFIFKIADSSRTYQIGAPPKAETRNGRFAGRQPEPWFVPFYTLDDECGQ